MIALMIICSIIILLHVTIVYKALAKDQQLFTMSRTTIPDNLPWYPLIVFGDNRPRNTRSILFPSVFYEIVREIKTIQPLALIGTGDHTGRGDILQVDELYRVLSEDLENVWLALGNHDLKMGQLQYWIKKVAPEYYKIDDIPGWRVAIINSEASLISWRNQLEEVLKGLYNRSVILVFHRPAYPYVEHNLASDKVSILMDSIKRFNHVKLILQGHWHGYGYERRENITWLITGGAGAPLYNYPKKPYDSSTIILQKYHYTILILYPNQTFNFIPILVGDNNGEVAVNKINSSAIYIKNTKFDIFGRPVSIPVRVRLNYGKWALYSVVMVPPYFSVIINYKVQDDMVLVKCNASNWYVYAVPLNRLANKTVVGVPVDGTVRLKLVGIRQELSEDQQVSFRIYMPAILLALMMVSTGVVYFLLTRIRRKVNPN